jgi:hypothetical protein
VASQSTSGPYLSSDRRLSVKLVPKFADRGCRVVNAANPHGRNFDFLDRGRYYFFQVAPQLSSRGWVDPVPHPLLLRKSGSAGNWTRDPCICSQKLQPLDHRSGQTSALSCYKYLSYFPWCMSWIWASFHSKSAPINLQSSSSCCLACHNLWGNLAFPTEYTSIHF